MHPTTFLPINGSGMIERPKKNRPRKIKIAITANALLSMNVNLLP
jgi:hypothetical protein